MVVNLIQTRQKILKHSDRAHFSVKRECAAQGVSRVGMTDRQLDLYEPMR